MQIHDSIENIKNVGPSTAKKLQKLNIHTAKDVLYYFPKRYDDYSKIVSINDIRPGPVCIKVTIKHAKGSFVRGGFHVTEAVASDATGSVKIVWFNQPYRVHAIKHNEYYYVAGIFELRKGRFSIVNPSMEQVSSFPVQTARILPVYRETKGLSSVVIRKIVKSVLQQVQVKDFLPNSIITENKLLNLADACRMLHFPASTAEMEQAKQRFAFEELFLFQLASQMNRRALEKSQAPAIAFNNKTAIQFVESLPFTLTSSQKKAMWQIIKNIDGKHGEYIKPMNRLLEGDVGSGKTVVATMIAAMVVQAGYQVAFLAPTEILAKQHFATMRTLMKSLGMEDRITLLVGSMTKKEKTVIYQADASTATLLVGTHALLEKQVQLPRLALAIIDEQHRFGVRQRQAMIDKAGHTPHLLSMTATPIPRTLTLTLYGELDISILKHKPHDRKATLTRIVTPARRQEIEDAIKNCVKRQEQAFVVCPTIDPQEEMPNIASVKYVHSKLTTTLKKEKIAIGLLHGQLPHQQKNEIMQDFAQRRIDVLVATSMVEVGVDIPNASLIIIESAERFGLAQIHQLRGRVGRGNSKGLCYLVTSENKPPSDRLRALEYTNDGFALAELDLQKRGAGAIYGTAQHGQIDLRIANLSDITLIKKTRLVAKQYLEEVNGVITNKELKEQVKKIQTFVHLN